jgi:hypothetical protein
LASGLQFRKGSQYHENGDFSSAGSANINYFNVLHKATHGQIRLARVRGEVRIVLTLNSVNLPLR